MRANISSKDARIYDYGAFLEKNRGCCTRNSQNVSVTYKSRLKSKVKSRKD